MERLTQQSAHDRITTLQKKLSHALEVVSHIAQPGWIESRQASVRPRSERSGQNLTLAGLTDEERWARLTQIIIPMQTTLLGEALPHFFEGINQLEAEEIARIRNLRDRSDISPLYPPRRNYGGVLPSDEIQRFLGESKNDRAKELISAFLSSPAPARVLNSIVKFENSATLQSTEFNKYFMGAIFEEIGFLYLCGQKQDQRSEVLSPEETIILFKNIHPERDFNDENAYGLYFAARGISLPDGLVITDVGTHLEITHAVEYKNIGRAGPKLDSIQEQLQYFTPEQLEVDLRLRNHQPLPPAEIGRLIHKIKPALAEKPVKVNSMLQTLYVVPKDRAHSLSGFLTTEVPVTSGFIHAFGEALKRVELLRR